MNRLNREFQLEKVCFFPEVPEDVVDTVVDRRGDVSVEVKILVCACGADQIYREELWTTFSLWMDLSC